MNDQPYPSQVPDWFEDTSPQPTKQQRGPHRSKRALMTILIIVAVILALSTVPALNYFSRPACLTTEAYYELTGTNYGESFSPTDNFYTTPITFLPATTTLDKPSATLMQNIANFYKKYEASSIRISISNFYASPSDHALTLKRAEILQSTALIEGVAPKVLYVDQPTLVEPEDESTSAVTSHSISITSVEGCR